MGLCNTIHNTQYTIHNTLYTIHYTLYTIHQGAQVRLYPSTDDICPPVEAYVRLSHGHRPLPHPRETLVEGEAGHPALGRSTQRRSRGRCTAALRRRRSGVTCFQSFCQFPYLDKLASEQVNQIKVGSKQKESWTLLMILSFQKGG